jgi:hypothetical protein
MKFLSFVICLFIVCISTTPFAAENSSGNLYKGQIGSDKKQPPYTNQQLDEALKVSDSCKAYSYTSLHYDCDCVGMTYLELRRKKGSNASAYWLQDAAQRKCPNAPAMAGKIYSECLGWAPFQRGEDYEEFCGCYGSTYAKIYSKNPSENLLVSESQMTEAMKECNVNSVNVREQERDAFVKQLKEKGTYKKLFPSAE